MTRLEILKILKLNRAEITDKTYSRNIHNYHLEELIDLIADIIVPPFQRDIEWKEDNMCALLNFLLKGETALNPLHLCKTRVDEVKGNYYTFHDRGELIDSTPTGAKHEPNVVFSIIDGLQRLTTLSLMTSGVKTTRIHFNLHQNSFGLATKAGSHKVPVHMVLGRDKTKCRQQLNDYFKGLKPSIKSAYLDNVDELRARIYFYQYKVAKTDYCDLMMQRDLFINLNSGKSISRIQKMVSSAKATAWPFHQYCDDLIKVAKLFYKDKTFIRASQRTSFPANALTAAFCALEGKIECAPPIDCDHIIKVWGEDWVQRGDPRELVKLKLCMMSKFIVYIAAELSEFLTVETITEGVIEPQYISRDRIASNGYRRHITLPHYTCMISVIAWHHRLLLCAAYKRAVKGEPQGEIKGKMLNTHLRHLIQRWIHDKEDFSLLNKQEQKRSFNRFLSMDRLQLDIHTPYNPKDSAKRRIILK